MSRTNCAIGKDYVPASFKGVLFYCKTADIEGGRRGAEGEFPFGEHTAYADLGRKIRVYNLTAAFREDDHVSDSHALFMACESPGPGILVHPTRGAVMAACRKCKLSDDIEESAGETTAELEFVEANEVGTGFGINLLFGIISTGLSLASSASFMASYRPTQVSQPWSRDVTNHAQRLVQSVATTARQVLPPDAPTSKRRTQIRVQEVANDEGLAANPVNVNRALEDGFVLIVDNLSDPDVKYKIMRGLANVATDMIPLPPGIAVESYEAVTSRHRILAVIGMAEAAMARKYRHVDEALLAMDQTLAVFADETRAAYNDCNNELFLELRKYAGEFATMMNKLAYGLPPLILVDFMGGVHPLVASYAIYKDAKRHRDLEPRNIIDANGRIGPIVAGIAPS